MEPRHGAGRPLRRLTWWWRLRRVWREMDQPVTGRRVAGTAPIVVAGALVGLAVSAAVVPTGFNLAYSDAQSHLTIARRLFDTASNPGLDQLGTVWLPVPHLLLAPFTASLWLWHTGWAGALLGAVCLGATTGALYRVAARWGAGRWARLTVVAVIATNPSMLYLCTTALTEPVLIASMALCLAGLASVATRPRPSSPGEIAVFCGIPAALAALSRYEGWALCATGALFVGVLTSRRGRWRDAADAMAGFLIPPGLAMGWWVGYNWVVFHDPLEFFNGQFSANAQQAQIVAQGASTRADLIASLKALDMAVSSSVGAATLAMAAAGLIVLLISRRVPFWGFFLVAAASSYLFLVVALDAGQAVIWNPAVRSGYIWNNRFGMATILPTSLLAAAAVEAAIRAAGRLPLPRIGTAAVAVVTAAVLVGQTLWFTARPAQRSLVISEAATSQASGAASREAAIWLGSHYDGGRILIDETGAANAHLPQIGLPLRNFDLQADGTLFHAAVRHPADHARWIWAARNGSDAVRPITTTASFRASYRVAYRNTAITIWIRNSP